LSFPGVAGPRGPPFDARQAVGIRREPIRVAVAEALAQSPDPFGEPLMKHLLSAVALVSLVAVAAPALAQAGHDHHGASAAKKAATDVVNTGEVKRINQDTKKITIAHGPLKAFDMPPMTMSFGVKDAALLGKVKQGDKVNFVLEKAGEDLVISRIEAAR
jgi:Cu(I)/Ag(I) efflux system protein CusF